MVYDDPLPVRLPGLIVQLPEGSPFNTTLPVDTLQVGWVIVPTVGVPGAPGAALIVTLPEGDDVQFDALVTVKL